MDLNDKKEYIQFIDSVCKSLKNDKFFKEFTTELGNGKNSLSIYRSQKKKSIDTDWIDMISASIVALDNIVRNPRRFIIREEEIVPIALSKSITTESIKHLAQHTNYISEVKGDTITPNKILNINKEESFEIYENRFAYTLLLRLKQFIDKRTELIKSSMTDNDIVNIDLHSKFNVGDKSLDYTIQLNTKASDADLEGGDDTAAQLERIMKISKVVDDFCSSPFAMSMRNYALVRPPITRTNVILKNPDFKKALSLWQFIETYDKTGFDVVTTESLEDVPTEKNEYLSDNLFINYLFYKNLIEINNPNEKVERKNKYSPRFVKKFLETVVKSGEIDDVELRNVIKEAYYGQHTNKQLDKKQVNNINSIIDSCFKLDEKYLLKIQKQKEEEERRLAAEEAKRQKEIEERLKRARIAQEKKEERERIKLEKQKALEEEQAKVSKEIQELGGEGNVVDDFEARLPELIAMNNRRNEPSEYDPIIYKKITTEEEAVEIINNAFRFVKGTVFDFSSMFEGEEDIDEELLEEYDNEEIEDEFEEPVEEVIEPEPETIEVKEEVKAVETQEEVKVEEQPTQNEVVEQEVITSEVDLTNINNSEVNVTEVEPAEEVLEVDEVLTPEQIKEREILARVAMFEENGETVDEQTDKESAALEKVNSLDVKTAVNLMENDAKGVAPTINIPKKKTTKKKSTKKKSSSSSTAKKSTSTSTKKSSTTTKKTSTTKATKPVNKENEVKPSTNAVSIDSSQLKDGLKIEINIVGDKVEVKTPEEKKTVSTSPKKKTTSSSTKKSSTGTKKKSTSTAKKKSTSTKKKTSSSTKKTSTSSKK